MKGKNSKPHFHVTAGLIWKNGKVLIAKRPKGSHLEGFWEFPGGKQEKGESLRRRDAGCSMLDKEKTFLIPFPLKTGFPLCYNKYPETSTQYHGLSSWNHKFFKNLTQMLIS